MRYLHFYPDFFGYVGKLLDEKAKGNFKIMTSQTRTQAITTNCQVPQGVNLYDQLIMRNVFLQK